MHNDMGPGCSVNNSLSQRSHTCIQRARAGLLPGSRVSQGREAAMQGQNTVLGPCLILPGGRVAVCVSGRRNLTCSSYIALTWMAHVKDLDVSAVCVCV